MNHKFRVDRAFGHIRVKVSPQIEKSKHVQARRGAARKFQRLTWRLPSIRDTGRQIDSGFVKVNQIEIVAAVGAGLPELGQMLLRRAKVFFVAHRFQAAAHSFPGVPGRLERSFERIGANRFSQLFFNLLTSRLQRSRRLGNDFKGFF